MSKLYDVKGPCRYKGQLLLEEDGWFEGIVTYPHGSSYRGDRFIFGACFPDKTINYFEFGVPDSPVLIITCDKNDEEYVGNLSAITPTGSRTLFSSNAQMMLEEVIGAERNVEAESESLKARIEEYKSGMKQSFKVRYSNHLLIRSTFCKDVLEMYKRSHQVLTIGTMHHEKN